MPRYIVKLKDQYLEWSTVVDAPVTYGMSREEMMSYLLYKYGVEGKPDERIARVEITGTSAMDGTKLDELIGFNRAGPREECLTLDEIYQRYCVERNA